MSLFFKAQSFFCMQSMVWYWAMFPMYFSRHGTVFLLIYFPVHTYKDFLNQEIYG